MLQSTGRPAIATPFDTTDLAQGISWILGDRTAHSALSHSARQRAVSLWAPGVIAQSYLDTYHAAIETHRSGRMSGSR